MNRMRHLWTLRGTTVDSTALSWTTNGGAQNRQVGRNRRAGRREKNPGWGQPSPKSGQALRLLAMTDFFRPSQECCEADDLRSEERSVGNECVSTWSSRG